MSSVRGRKRNGVCPAHFCHSAGSVARKALQSLEQLKLIEKGPDGGRKLTIQGRRDIDRIAAQVRQKRKQQQLLLAQQSGITVQAPVPVAPAAAVPAVAAAADDGSWS